MEAKLQFDIKVQFVNCPPKQARAYRMGTKILWSLMERAIHEEKSNQMFQEDKNGCTSDIG